MRRAPCGKRKKCSERPTARVPSPAEEETARVRRWTWGTRSRRGGRKRLQGRGASAIVGARARRHVVPRRGWMQEIFLGVLCPEELCGFHDCFPIRRKFYDSFAGIGFRGMFYTADVRDEACGSRSWLAGAAALAPLQSVFPACRFATHARNRQFPVAPTSNRPLARPRPWQVRSRARHPRGSRLAPPPPPPPRDARDARRRLPRHRRRRFALAPRPAVTTPAATTPTARHRARRTRSCGSMPGGRLCATRPRRARRRRAPSGSRPMRSRGPLARRALFTTRRRPRDARRRTSRRPRSCARRV